MRLLFGLFALAVLLPIPTVGQSQDPASVEAALHEFLDGASRQDAAAHALFWAEDLIYTSSSGERFGKDAILSALNDESGDPVPESTNYSAEQVNIRFEHDLAILTFTLVAKTVSNEHLDVVRYFNSGVLKYQSHQNQPPNWQAIVWQATAIPNNDTGDAEQR